MYLNCSLMLLDIFFKCIIIFNYYYYVAVSSKNSHSLPAPTWILDYLRFDLLIGLQLLFLLVWVVLVSSIVSAQWASLMLPVGSEIEEKLVYYYYPHPSRPLLTSLLHNLPQQI